MLAKAAYVYREGPCSARATRSSIEHRHTRSERSAAIAEQWPHNQLAWLNPTISQCEAAAPAVPGGGGARGSAGGGRPAALCTTSFSSLGGRPAALCTTSFCSLGGPPRGSVHNVVLLPRYSLRTMPISSFSSRRPFVTFALAFALTRCGASTAPTDSAVDAIADRASMADAVTSDTLQDSAVPMDTGVASDATADVLAPRDTRVDDAIVADSGDSGVARDVILPDVTTGPSCDARRVVCDRIPPTCAPGEAPSVSGACWGPCVQATTCVCTSTAECPMVRGFSEICYPFRMRCGPLL